MDLSKLKELREASPFVPFTDRMADGRSWRVQSRDFIAIPPPAPDTVLLFKEDGGFIILHVKQIAEAVLES